MKRARFVVIGGPVYSASDGQRHWVGPLRLVELYGVDRRECILCSDDEDARRRLQGVDWSGLVVLGPRSDGRYRQAPNSPAAAS